MLEFPFALKRTPGMKEMVAAGLLGYACSDDAHGTHYFEPALLQYILYRMRSKNGFYSLAVA